MVNRKTCHRRVGYGRKEDLEEKQKTGLLNEDEEYELAKLQRQGVDTGAYKDRERALEAERERNVAEKKRKKEEREAAERKRLSDIQEQHKKELADLKAKEDADLEKMKKDLEDAFAQFEKDQEEYRKKERYREEFRLEQQAEEEKQAEEEQKEADEQAEKDYQQELADDEAARQKEIQDRIDADEKEEHERRVQNFKGQAEGALSSLKNHQECSTTPHDRAAEDQFYEHMADEQEEQQQINKAQEHITGAGRSVKDQMYLINKRYTELMGNEQPIITYNSASKKKKNKMKGGKFWLIVFVVCAIVDVVTEVVDAVQESEEQKREREQEEREALDDLEGEFNEYRNDYKESLMADIEDEQAYQDKRAEFARELNDQKPPLTDKEKEELMKDLDDRRRDNLEDVQDLKDEINEAIVEENEDFQEKKQDLEDEFDDAVQALNDVQEDKMDAIREIYDKEEEVRDKLREEHEAELQKKQEEHKKIEDERDKKEEERKKKLEAEAARKRALEDRIMGRYNEVQKDLIQQENAIASLTNYQQCSANTKSRDELLHIARKNIEKEERDKEEAEARGVVIPQMGEKPIST
jgi:hypothetical protein